MPTMCSFKLLLVIGWCLWCEHEDLVFKDLSQPAYNGSLHPTQIAKFADKGLISHRSHPFFPCVCLVAPLHFQMQILSNCCAKSIYSHVSMPCGLMRKLSFLNLWFPDVVDPWHMTHVECCDTHHSPTVLMMHLILSNMTYFVQWRAMSIIIFTFCIVRLVCL